MARTVPVDRVTKKISKANELVATKVSEANERVAQKTSKAGERVANKTSDATDRVARKTSAASERVSRKVARAQATLAEVMPADPVTTRERILDIALELFTEKGFDKTSLREIADRLGFSKAAIYYHFASKEDILMAIHMRLHDFGREALDAIGQTEATPEVWATLLDQVIGQMLENRALFLFHERNQAAIENLHKERHDADHEDLQVRFRQALSNPVISLEARVRMASSFGAVMASLALAGDVFSDVSSDELGGLLRKVVAELLAVGTEGAVPR